MTLPTTPPVAVMAPTTVAPLRTRRLLIFALSVTNKPFLTLKSFSAIVHFPQGVTCIYDITVFTGLTFMLPIPVDLVNINLISAPTTSAVKVPMSLSFENELVMPYSV